MLRDIAAETANRLGMAVELLARKRDVEACVRHYEAQHVLPAWFSGWRDELVGDSFLQVLSGQLS
jgi:ribonuclease D